MAKPVCTPLVAEPGWNRQRQPSLLLLRPKRALKVLRSGVLALSPARSCGGSGRASNGLFTCIGACRVTCPH